MATDDPRERQPPHVQAWQDVLNTHWPDHPREFRTHWPGIAVDVRLVFAEDGEDFLEGVAKRWDSEHVYVELRWGDKRVNGNGVWVKPVDVYRRRHDSSMIATK